VVDVLDAGKSLGTHRSPCWGIRVALDMRNNTVFHGNQDTAAAVAAFAGCFNNIFSHMTSLFENDSDICDRASRF
jgi:hypothetical protein